MLKAKTGMAQALPPIPDSNVLDWLTARRAYAEEDYESVLRLLVPYAESGTESAQRIVAHAYRNTGQFGEAAPWYRDLAEKGDAASQFYPGMLYQKGLGVEQYNQAALEWLNRALAQGDARAIHALALSTQTIEVLKQLIQDSVRGHRKCSPMWSDTIIKSITQRICDSQADNDVMRR